jgi:alkanesulfonate monooxygenase SsuD/methylene tetrahydromethanopterin reductase-like flavin-dependent oxidoreductase (luciferase family)
VVSVHCAVGLPNVGEFGDPRILLDLAVAAEESGWDGVYLWDHVLYREPTWPVANPVVAMSAIAAATSRVRLGILMTALPRRRVQTVARETASLDLLCGGRLVFGAGLGSMDAEYRAFGEEPDLRVRAARLDESLAALAELWSGEPVTYRGEYVTVDGVTMRPPPVQRPRMPVWCAARWPNRAGLRRAARWDGAMPTFADYGRGRPVPVGQLADAVDFLRTRRAGGLDGFDVAMEGWSEPAGGAGLVSGYARAGLTWWVEALGWWRGGVAAARARIAAGPPR